MSIQKYHVSKNLFDISMAHDDYAPTVYHWKLTGLIPNVQYTCSTNFVQIGESASIWFGGTASGVNGVSNNSPKTMTANASGEIDIYINHVTGGAYSQIANGTVWLMVNSGTTALPYEPYGNTWNSIPYRKYGTETDSFTSFPAEIIGDGTNATVAVNGQSSQAATPSASSPVYLAGVGDLDNGQYKLPIFLNSVETNINLGLTQSTRQIKKFKLDGTEGWTKSRNDDTAFFKLQLSDYKLQTVAFCSHFEYVNVTQSGTTLGFYIVLGSGMIRIRPENVATTSLESFLSFLSTQYSNGTPVTIYYVLDTPETIISNEPLYKIDNYSDSISTSIPTTDGANILDIPTTLQPSSVDVNYHGWHNAEVKERDGSEWQ